MDKEELEKRKQQLKQLQSEPLGLKIQNTMAKVMEFYNWTNGNCVVVFDESNLYTDILVDIIERFVKPLINRNFKYSSCGGEYIMLATIVEDSQELQKYWYENGCNSSKDMMSRPLSFWTKKDIEEYRTKYLDNKKED